MLFFYLAVMAKILIQFAHPNLEKSRVQKHLIRQAAGIRGVTVNDLYEQYPDFDINIPREKALLITHDIIIFQHPLYWYSTPAIIKQWFDLVLEHGWAYGSNGNALENKKVFNCISCGGSEEAYTAAGRNRFTIRQLLSPVEQTSRLCKMEYLPPFVVYGTHKLQKPDIETAGMQYTQILHGFCNEKTDDLDWDNMDTLNALSTIPSHS